MQPLYYIASADWMKRNLNNRIEVAVPIKRALARERLREQLAMCLSDPWAWEMVPDGSYRRPATRTGEAPRSMVLRGYAPFSRTQMEVLAETGTQNCLMWSILQKLQLYSARETGW